MNRCLPFLALSLLALPGCFSGNSAKLTGVGGDQANKQEVSFAPKPGVPLPAMPGEQAAHDATLKDVAASNNATQQTLSGVGLQMGKLVEKVQGFGGDLAHLENKIETSVKASAELNADVRNTLEAKLTAQATATAQANAELRAELKTEVSALGGAQAGLRNELQQLTQNVSAGHDSTVSTINFSKEMRDVLMAESAARVQDNRIACGAIVTVVHIMAGVLIVMANASRKRADDRAKKLHEHVLASKGIHHEDPT